MSKCPEGHPLSTERSEYFPHFIAWCPTCGDREDDAIDAVRRSGTGDTPEEAIREYVELYVPEEPPPLPKPSVKRWDPIAGLWVKCIIENEQAWCPRVGGYTAVRPEELEPVSEP